MSRKYKRTNFSGQHLLHNKIIIQNMIEECELKSKDTVVDLGAGKGAITFPLAKKAGRIIAIENDPTYVKILHEKAENYSNIIILEENILTWNLPKNPFYVVSNIPYSITTPILERLLSQPTNQLQRAILTMEKGAAIRFTSNAITDPRILQWRMWFELKVIKVVSKKNFSPPPKVDSVILKIKRKINPKIPVNQHRVFMALAQFGLKNPTMSINEVLKHIFTPQQMKRLLKNIGVDRYTPIKELNVHQWEQIFLTMVQYVEPFRWPKMKKRTKK